MKTGAAFVGFLFSAGVGFAVGWAVGSGEGGPSSAATWIAPATVPPAPSTTAQRSNNVSRSVGPGGRARRRRSRGRRRVDR